MNILVVGGGGREHAIIKAIKKNPIVSKIWCLPGNGGIAQDAECFDIKSTDIPGICSFAASHDVDYAIIAQDDPLALGAVDELNALGIPCFGPDAKAAQIEASKVFSKDLMRKYGIPTARYETFDNVEAAFDYIDTQDVPIVVKADGLALGKGVIIAQTRDEAKTAIREMIEGEKFGKSGKTVVIEEFLTGPEVTVLSFTDGKTVVPMISSMDHKRAHDGDSGLNTGGMGVIAPNPYYTAEIADICMDQIFLPTIRAMAAEGRPFKGCLYFGLMLTPKGPKVIEYNCRFGDPEAQAVLPLMKSDLLTVMQAVTDGHLGETDVEFFSDRASCCVIMASGGYPESYKKGFEISIGSIEGELYIAGASAKDGKLVTSGGRVLGVTDTAPTLAEAIEKAYRDIENIRFEGGFFRHDIGQKALKA